MIMLIFLISSLFAAESGYQCAKGFAKNMTAKNKKPTDASGIPHAKSTAKEESYNNQNLANATPIVDDPAYMTIRKAKGSRPSFKIDGDKDPLLHPKSSETWDTNKEKNESILDTSLHEKEGVKVCLEAGEEYIQKCSKILEIKTHVIPEKNQSYKFCPGHGDGIFSFLLVDTWFCSGCCTHYQVIPKQVEIVSEKWLDGCTHLEKLTEEGFCRYESMTQSLKNETRKIDGEPFTRDHFEEYFVYSCMKKTDNKDCENLRGKGCIQTASKCIEKLGNSCILYEQTYQCPSRKVKRRLQGTTKGKNVFCENGDCFDVVYEDNDEFYSAIGHIAILNEAQKDMAGQELFKGVMRGCNRNCIDFRDCCGNGKGWGVAIGLAHCDAEAKELMELRKVKRCVFVGTFCAEKILGICIRKKSTFCCFSSKMARIVQEQGRAQLGLNFGKPDCPNCRSLTFEEFSRLDFSKINLGELFGDLMSSMKIKTKNDLPQKTLEGLHNNMSELQKNFTKKDL